MIYILNNEDKVIGAYEDNELEALGVDALAQRDFIEYKRATHDDNYEPEDEENMANEQWIAELVDAIQNAGYGVKMVNNEIIASCSELCYSRILYSFDNWSEVEYWLKERGIIA